MKIKNFFSQIKKEKAIVAFLLLIFLNIVLWFLPLKVDFTAKKTYTLSQTTKKIVGDLDDIVNIKIFASKNLPSKFLLIKQQLKDLLTEYRFLSKGKIKLTWVDPDKQTEAVNEAQRLGIPQLQFSNIEKDKFQVTQGFLGLAVLFEDKAEVIPLVETTDDLEYQLTSKIHKLTSDKQPKIGLTTGHGEQLQPPSDKPYGASVLEEILADEFLTEQITISSGSADLIPDTFDILLVVGPNKEFDKNSKYILDQFLMQGKPIAFFLETKTINNNLQVQDANHQLFDLLKHYGLELKKGFVLDVSNEIANFSTGMTVFLTPYPFWVKTLPQGMNKDNLITHNLESLVFPWTSWLEYDENDDKIIPLVYSSNKSWTEEEGINLDPAQEFEVKEDGKKLLAAVVSGKLTSFFKDKDIPTGFNNEEFIEAGDKVKLALVADSEFVNERMARRAPQNLHFFINLVEYLSGGEGLSEIRVKTEDIRPLKLVSDQERELFKYANIFGIPILIAVLGFIYLYRQNKKEYKL